MGVDFEFKLGLDIEKKKDKRDILFGDILKEENLPTLPEAYDVHDKLQVIDNREFGNRAHPDCVIAQQAHFTLTLEKREQAVMADLPDEAVLLEYYRQTGNRESGLLMSSALKQWRTHGILVGDKSYTIYSYNQVPTTDFAKTKYCIYLLDGISIGAQMFSTDIDQFKAGLPWRLTGKNNTFEGGHAMYGFAYNDNEIKAKLSLNSAPKFYWVCTSLTGVWLMTWGQAQFAEWDWWQERVLQSYGVVDQRDRWLGENSAIDVVKNDALLQKVTGTPSQTGGCLSGLISKVFQR